MSDFFARMVRTKAETSDKRLNKNSSMPLCLTDEREQQICRKKFSFS